MQDSKKHSEDADNEKEFPGYPHYKADEDIYKQDDRVLDERVGQDEEIDPEEPPLDQGLDIPGADLDDTQEEIGSEDEENNYYSLGGDNHDD